MLVGHLAEMIQKGLQCKEWAVDVAQWLETLSNMYKALGSISRAEEKFGELGKAIHEVA